LVSIELPRFISGLCRDLEEVRPHGPQSACHKAVNRRSFLQSLFVAGVRIPLRGSSLIVVPLGDDVFQLSGAGANILLLSNDDGVLLVNGGLPEHSAGIMKLISERFPSHPLRVLFNTDWHWENTGLNETATRAGASIVAHVNTKLWLDTQFFSRWQNRAYKPRPKEALPTKTFYTTGNMTFGNEEIVYGHLGQAHTDGDIYVHFKRRNILSAGDVVTVGSYPILDYSTGGWIGGIVNATRTLLNIADAGTRIVPGSGPLQSKTQLQTQYDMLSTVRDRVVKLMKQGMGGQEIIDAAPTKDFDERWGNPELFLGNIYPGLWGHVRELGGVI
jgi:cyclase